MDLRRKAIRDADVSVTFADIASYRRAAVATAVAIGKPKTYFRSTKAYGMFHKEMIRNYLLQYGVVKTIMTARHRMLSKPE
jgi:hypothetical protein